MTATEQQHLMALATDPETMATVAREAWHVGRHLGNLHRRIIEESVEAFKYHVARVLDPESLEYESAVDEFRHTIEMVACGLY
jgi:hypothetical protein